MSDRPDFVAQTAEPMTAGQRYKWFQDVAKEFRRDGATWMQYSIDDKHEPYVALLEAWEKRPEKQPEPHFLRETVAPKRQCGEME